MTVFRGVGAEVVLPSAEFGDEHTIDGGLKLKKMMDKTKVSYVRTPVLATYALRFTEVPRNKVEEFRSFLINNAGRKINMIDHMGYRWEGHITTQPHTFTHAGIRNCQFGIEFEGHIYEQIDISSYA